MMVAGLRPSVLDDLLRRAQEALIAGDVLRAAGLAEDAARLVPLIGDEGASSRAPLIAELTRLFRAASDDLPGKEAASTAPSQASPSYGRILTGASR